MLKIGVAGCGKIAQVRHLPEYRDNENVEIAGVYDLNYDRAKEVAHRYHTKAFKEFEMLLEDKDIVAVSICTANASHCEMAVAAMKAGKHVLCEKPMAVTLEECEYMVKTAKEEKRFLMIGHNQRLALAHKKAKELIEAGEIGRLLTFKTTFGHGGPETWTIDSSHNWFFDKKIAAFGAMADLGIHKTDLIQYITGQKVEKVTAFLGTLDKRDAEGKLIGVDDNAICIYQMDGGCVGTMTASWTYYTSEDNSTVLYGTEGMMRIYDNPDYSIVVEHKDGTCTYYQTDKIQTNDSQTSSGVIDLWVDCLLKDQKPEISGEEALSAMRAVFGALKSSETGRTVVISEMKEV